jgi:integrase
MLLEEGEDIAVVAELLRHTNPDFTRRRYQHVRTKLKRSAALKIDARMRRR